MLSQLCANCQNIFGSSQEEQRNQYLQHHSPFDVETASVQGCHPCTIFAGQIQEYRKRNSLDSTPYSTALREAHVIPEATDHVTGTGTSAVRTL